MRLTSLDIHHKEFRHSLRGYAEEEVDQFLDQVADEFDRLFKENVDLSERLEAVQRKLDEYEMQRQTINNTLLAAQRSADDIKARADADYEAAVRDAEMKAREIIHAALSKKQQVASELARIKQAEEEFRAQYRALLEQNLRSVSEVGLPDDVSILMETDAGLAAEPEMAETPAPASAAPAAVPQQAAAAPAPAPVSTPAAEEATDPQGTQAMPAAPARTEVPEPGFVQSMAFGESESPEIPEDVELVEPSEFNLPGFGALGEREQDVDIEEID